MSTFVPKPHTPFQWVPCDTIEQIRAKQDLLRRQLRGPGLKLNWNSPEDTLLEDGDTLVLSGKPEALAVAIDRMQKG